MYTQVQSAMWGKLTGANSPHNVEEISEEQLELYRPLFQQAEAAVNQFMGKLAPPTVTSNAIIHALTSPYPRTRYVVAGLAGTPLCLVRGAAKFVPDRILDKIKLMLL